MMMMIAVIDAINIIRRIRFTSHRWNGYESEERLIFAQLRGEYLYFKNADNKLLRLCPFEDNTHFGTCKLSANIITSRELEVFEERRGEREMQMCAVGCEIACAIDFCKHTGKVLGKNWQVRHS